MGILRRIGCVFLAVLALLPARAHAQGLTATLTGTVKDSQGGVLAGATVRVNSPALIGGERTAISGENGQWRFPILAPGTYVLTVELPPRFTGVRGENITLKAGATFDLIIILKLAGFAQSTSAEATSPVARGAGLESRFGPDDLTTIATSRNSFFDLLRSALGASPTSPSSRTNHTVSFFGSGVNESIFLIDGTNFTCPCQGVSRAEPIVDVIEEVHVQSMGASVEYGGFQGAVVNIVTRQGGPHFTSDAAYFGQSSTLTAQPVVLAVTRGTQPSSGYERVRYRDLSSNLGGPVVRDRLWFFSAYQYLRDYDSQPGTDPAYPRKYEQNKVFGKLNWKLSPSLHLMQSFHEEIWVNPTPPTLVTPFVATTRTHGTVPNMTFGHLTHIVSSNTVWEARIGRFVQEQTNDPSTGDRTTPSHRDQQTGVSSGNAAQIGGPTFERVTAKAVLHRYQSGWLGVDHTFKAGTQIELGQHKSITVFPGGVQFLDNNGPFQTISRDPSITGGRFVTSALFGSDSLTIRNRVTIDGGIRFDHSVASSRDLPAIDAQGRETDGVLKGFGRLYTWNVVSPRGAVAAKLTADGRTTLRATYGRFNQGVLTGELDPIHPGVTPITTMVYEQATGGYTKRGPVVDPTLNLSLDPHTRTPHTDELSLAFDRALGSHLVTSTAYIRKRGSDFIGWIDTGGQYDKTEILVDGTKLPVKILTNTTADRRFLLTNPDTLFLEYDGFVVAMEKRLSKSWQASGSYTFSRTYGRQVSSNALVSEAQFNTVARGNALTFGQDPNDLTNTEGRLLNDRPHIFRVNGVVHLPWQGILVSANLQYFSGKPWAATAQVSLPQGNQRILLESRGSRRLSSQSLLNLRVSKTLRLHKVATVDVLVDVLNLLNDTAEEGLQSDLRVSPVFGKANQIIDPRRAMIGVRVHLGR